MLFSLIPLMQLVNQLPAYLVLLLKINTLISMRNAVLATCIFTLFFMNVSFAQTNENTTSSTVNTLAYPEGGMNMFYEYIAKSILKSGYQRIDRNAAGTVMVKFKVTKDNEMINFSIAQSVSEKIDEIALAIVKNGPSWNAAIYNGQAYDSYVSVPVKFQYINNQGETIQSKPVKKEKKKKNETPTEDGTLE
jgi:hypothetical protein